MFHADAVFRRPTLGRGTGSRASSSQRRQVGFEYCRGRRREDHRPMVRIGSTGLPPRMEPGYGAGVQPWSGSACRPPTASRNGARPWIRRYDPSRLDVFWAPQRPQWSPAMDPGRCGLGVGEDSFDRGLTVAGVHDAGLSSFQWPSETTSMLPSVTLMAV